MNPIDPKAASKLKVFKQKRLAGTLTRTSQGARFEYEPAYLRDEATEPVAFHLPKTPYPYEVNGSNLHPFFAGLLPEGLRLKALVKGLKTSEDDLFTILASLGAACVGDVWAESGARVAPKPSPKLAEIEFLSYFEEVMRAPLENLPAHDAFAGVQGKLSASMISFPLNIAKSTKAYLLKLNSKEFAKIVENESACLAFARACGLRVCTAKIVRDRGQAPGLLVERFDRRWNEVSGNFDFAHVEDACQFSNRYPADKYRLSLSEVATQMREWCQAFEIDLLELVEQYAFSYLICNGDLHAKNISLIRDPSTGRVSLSPAYDLVCTLPYGDQKMALKLDGRDSNIKARNLVDFAGRFGVREKAISVRLARLVARFRKRLPRFLAEMEAVLDDAKGHSHLSKEIEKRANDLDSIAVRS